MNPSLLKKALPHAIAVLIFWIVAVVYCKPALEHKIVSQVDMLGYKGMFQQSAEFKEKYGHYPLWTESTFSGMPTYNIAIEAKPNIVPGWLSRILTLGMPKPISFFLLACVTFYFLAMVMGVNPWIGVLSALAYAWSTYDPIIVMVGHETKMLAIGYAPGVIAALLLIYRRNYLWGAVLLAIFCSFQANTQHFQVVYYTLLSAGLLTICHGIYSWKQQQIKSFLMGIGIAAIAGGVGFATMAVLIVPVQEFAKETMRGGRTELSHPDNKLGENGGLNRDYAFTWSYGIPETFSLLAPRAAGGGNAGKEVGDDSKVAEKLTETFGMPLDQALQYANQSIYWGAQDQGTSGPVYLGAIVCLLGILGIVYLKGWQKWWLVSVAVLGILLAWGKNFPSLNNFLFDHLPFYNKFRSPTIALIMPQFAFPLLGALGLQQLFFGGETREANWKKFKTAVLITGGLLLLLTGYYFMADYSGGSRDKQFKDGFTQGALRGLSKGQQPTPEMQAQASGISESLLKALHADRQSILGADLLRSILLIAAAVLLLGLYLKDKFRQREVLLGGLIILSTWDLLSVGLRYLSEDNFVDPADFEARLAPTAVDLQIKNDPEKNFRVFDQTGDPFQLSEQSARTSYNHNSIGGYSPAKLGLYQDIIQNQLSKGNLRVYDMLNAKYFIQEDPTTRQPAARLNPGAYGACWLVKSIYYVKDGDAEMKALDSINTRDTVIVQEKYKALVKSGPVPDSSASIHLTDNLLDKISYKFSSKTNQFAVFSEVYYENGWNAFIDGQKTDYLRVDYLLRGMPVPAGEHTIEFRFEPHSYQMGNSITVWSSALVWLALIAAIIVEWRKRDQPKISKPA
ncbi:MAG TPA: YfhO family protein [Puia sp.]|nr:YfhO family protein [Puia sp.]